MIRTVKTGRRGVTFVEVVLVTLVLGIIAAVGIGRYVGALSNHRTAAAARRVIADLALAQRHAKMTSASQTVTFTAATDTYSMPGISDPDFPAANFTVKLARTPYKVDVVSASFGGDGSVVFDGFGRPDSSGTVVLTSGGNQITIQLDRDSGLARVQ